MHVFWRVQTHSIYLIQCILQMYNSELKMTTPLPSLGALLVVVTQLFILPCYFVLVSTLGYVLWTIRCVLKGYDEVTCVHSPLFLHGWTSKRYILTSTNTLLLYQSVYFCSFLYSCAYYSPICSTMREHNSGCNSDSGKWCWAVGQKKNPLLPIPHSAKLYVKTHFPEIECSVEYQCFWNAIQPEFELVHHNVLNDLGLPPCQRFTLKVLIESIEDNKCHPFNVRLLHLNSIQNASWIQQLQPDLSRQKMACKSQEFVIPQATFQRSQQHSSVAILVVQRHPSKTVRLLTQSNHRPLLQTPFSPINKHWDNWENLFVSKAFVTVGTLTTLFSWAVTFLISVSTFHANVQHVPSVFCLYVHFPIMLCFLWMGTFVGLFSILLASITKVNACNSHHKSKRSYVLRWISVCCAIAQLIYLFMVFENETTWKHFHKSNVPHVPETHNFLKQCMHNIFWMGSFHDSAHFLFYPCVLFCFYCIATAIGFD